jgi:hypothetical protein
VEKKPTIPKRENDRIRLNLRRATKQLINAISGWGYDVYVSYSGRTKSRYLQFKVSKNEFIKIRLSDHPSKRQWRYAYDVYTERQRKNALTVKEAIEKLERWLHKEINQIV